MEVFKVLSESIFIGFVVTVVAGLIIDLDKLSSAILKIGRMLMLGASCFFLLHFVLSLILEISSNEVVYASNAVLNQLNGPFWWACIAQFIFIGIVPQLLWRKKFYSDKRMLNLVALMVGVGILSGILPFLFFSYFSDQHSELWDWNFPDIIVNSVLNLVLYFVLLLFILTMKERRIPFTGHKQE